VPGTVAYTQPVQVGEQEVYPFEEVPFNTGRIAGTTNFIEVNPLPITEQLLQTVLAADVLARDILAALDLLTHPLRLVATLRS
jgi:hypothetical protein